MSLIMKDLNRLIDETQVSPGTIGLFYLGQAGFCIKTSRNQRIIIDAYLSDAAERLFGFKRMIPAVISPHSLDADLFLSTHSHIDHLDLDILPIVAENASTQFVGAPDCKEHYDNLGLNQKRYVILEDRKSWEFSGIKITGVFADHGELAPEAIGLLVEVDGVKIYHVGDTCYRPDEIRSSLDTEVDIMIAPINGQFGNMIATEACQLGAIVKPKILIPCHFWMFLEHAKEGGAGDPATFLKESKDLPDGITSLVMAPGEKFEYKK